MVKKVENEEKEEVGKKEIVDALGYEPQDITIHDFKIIYKTDKWWKFVVKYTAYGRDEISIYLLLGKNEEWQRKQKLSIKSADEWMKINKAVQNLLPL